MLAHDALRELARRAAGGLPGLLAGLFAQQVAFMRDPARSKAAICTRRAGKTYADAAYLLSEAYATPGVVCPYIALTRGHAKRLLWPELHRFKERYGMRYELRESELTVRCENGSEVWLVGADDARKVERLRGGKYKLVVIDEPGSFARQLLEYMMLDVIEPALIDLDGTLCLTGTPSVVPAGVFYDATTSEQTTFSVHRWSLLDNPHIPHAARAVAAIKAKYGWNDQTPRFRREYLGEWVRDIESVVYRYERQKNWIDALPDHPESAWCYVLGIDYGVKDHTAFSVIGWVKNVPHKVYLLESWGRAGMLSGDAAAEVEKLMARYRFSAMVGDEGGLGKLFQEELRRRFGIPVRPAQKTSKRGFIELMNGDIQAGHFKVLGPKCKEWIEEAMVCQWDEDREREDEQYSNHRLDAALYAWREARAFSERSLAPKKSLEEIEEERLKKLEQRMKSSSSVAGWKRY